MRFNLYTIYDKVAKKTGKIYMSENDEVAKRNFEDTKKKWKEQGLTIIDKELTVLNIGVYNTKVIENKHPNGMIEGYEDLIVCDIVYDIYNVPVGYVPKSQELDDEEQSFYKQFIEEIKKNKKKGVNNE